MQKCWLKIIVMMLKVLLSIQLKYEYNPRKRRKILIAFDDRIASMISSKKNNPIVAPLFTRGRKLNISLVLMFSFFSCFSCFHFTVPKNIRVNSAHHFIIKISSR